MSLEKIIHIAGINGLHKVIAQSKGGFIAESLSDKKRFAVAATQKVSMLNDISIFTTGEDVKLIEVFRNMKKLSDADLVLDVDADGATIKNYFKKILPEFDADRVYPSDIKKVAKWYAIVKDLVTDKDEEEVKSGDDADAAPGEEKKSTEADS